MNPQDDPEARIRDLERPLADVAQATELGVGPPGGPAYPTAPPPPAYGTNAYPTAAASPSYGPPYGMSYGTPAPARPGGFRGWWVVFGAAAAVLLIVGLGVAIYSATTSTVDGRGSAVGGGGSVGVAPALPPPGPRPNLPSRPADPRYLVITGPPGASLNVSGISENRTVACNDNPVSISGVSNTVTITGHCTSVEVSGMQNAVSMETADAITASGFENRVTYRSGAPKVENAGNNNVVVQG